MGHNGGRPLVKAGDHVALPRHTEVLSMYVRLARLFLVFVMLAASASCAGEPRPIVLAARPATRAAGSSGSDGLEVSLMSFNIRFDNPRDGVNGWSSRRLMVADILQEQRSDFIGLQEALRSQLNDLGPPKPYVHVGVGRDDGKL